MKYRFLKDLTSDVAFEVYGKDEKELLENAGEALFSIISDIKKVKPKKKIVVEVESKDIAELVYNWLERLIAIVDIEGMFLSKFRVISISKAGIAKIECKGEPISPSKGKTLVKAVTKHKYNVEKEGKGLKATVTLDI
jgi:SHS2 domain-containing protein